MIEQDSLTNQTQFSDEGMYFESTPPDIDPNTPRPPFFASKTGKLTLVGLGVLGFLLVVIGLAALVGSNHGPLKEAIQGFQPKPQRDLSETEQKVVVLKQLLTTADPTKEQDPFPPINLTFRLDPAEK